MPFFANKKSPIRRKIVDKSRQPVGMGSGAVQVHAELQAIPVRPALLFAAGSAGNRARLTGKVDMLTGAGDRLLGNQNMLPDADA
jgi:hypothetical protein